MPEDKIAALLTPDPDETLFTPRELLAIELADRMTESGHAVSDDLWQRLHETFTDGEVVELAAAIGLFNYFNRFNDALRMEITR